MHRTLGTVFMIVGVIGFLCNLMLIPAIWVGHNMLDQQVGVLATQVRSPLQQTVEATGQAQDRLQTLRTSVDKLPTSQLLARLDDTVSPGYQRLKESYLTMRDRLQAAAQTVDTLRQIAPWLPTLQLPLDDLRAVDAQLTEFDAALQQIRAGLTNGVQLLDNTMDAITGAMDNVASRAQQAIAQVDSTEATVKNLLTAVASVLTLLCLYGAALHVALFAYGRSLGQRSAPASQPLTEAPVNLWGREAGASSPGST